MNFIDIIKLSGTLPSKAETSDGTKLELFIRKKTGNKGYIAAVWVMVDGVQDRILEYGTGSTPELARGDLKVKILNPL